jgi:starvation-inducible DNA-binding protein
MLMPTSVPMTHRVLAGQVRQIMMARTRVMIPSSSNQPDPGEGRSWNDKGPHFIGLHELFDKIAEAVEDYVDMIAERIVQLGGIAQGTVRAAAARSRLEEYPPTIADGSAHVEAVAKALSTFGREARVSIDEANTLDDPDTADLFTEVSRGIDKWLWFVEAHAQASK